jgi:putative ABC transport system permease protein
LLVQIGLFVGFLDTSSALVRRVGGDVWVMARGTEVLDNGAPVGPAARARLAANPCVTSVRGLVVAVAPFKKPSGAVDFAQIVGVDPSPGRQVPWSLARGLPADLLGPLRVAVDEHDLEKLQITGDPVGAPIDVGGRRARVAALTHGIRSFALYPYLFADIANARRLADVDAASAQYWVADLAAPACAAAVLTDLASVPGLDAHTTDEFADLTERFWVVGSGAGGALGFSAIFALVVGAVIVGQTLFSITKEHLKELATLKAMGGSPRELVAFVAWQGAFLAVAGGVLGFVLAKALERALSSQGVEVVVSRSVTLLGGAAVATMCVLASLPSVRKALTLEAAEVFR